MSLREELIELKAAGDRVSYVRSVRFLEINFLIKWPFLLWFVCINTMCTNPSKHYLAEDVRIYKSTEAWKLANCVQDENVDCIVQLCKKEPLLLNFQDPKFGYSILHWAIYKGRVKSTKTLIRLGADPNLQSFSGNSAFVRACAAYETSEFAELMIAHGADVNAVGKFEGGLPLRTPLIAASMARLETVKLLIHHGADVNYIYKGVYDALSCALRGGKMDIAEYLIFEANADVTRIYGLNVTGTPMDLAYKLRFIVFPLDSEEYRIKMKIVNHISQFGLDYWNTPIPKHFYDNLDSTFLEKY